ncbi:hypothetical protein NPIL_492941 [Nephila pilipes]|uniref:Uncharacterized protein n=1 Tax=Nephila pilipes TaxID=299642 RepID=A0A8X6TEV3_NEPPI|nr:hypothetical protein NPIL_492941 [Nephila pilipes]
MDQKRAFPHAANVNNPAHRDCQMRQLSSYPPMPRPAFTMGFNYDCHLSKVEISAVHKHRWRPMKGGNVSVIISNPFRSVLCIFDGEKIILVPDWHIYFNDTRSHLALRTFRAV